MTLVTVTLLLLLWSFRGQVRGFFKWLFKLRLWIRLRCSLEEEKIFHCGLLLGSALLAACGCVWMHYNPLAGQLIYIQETMDTSNFDWPAANRMVETSRYRGTLIVFICAGVLSLVSILRLLQYVDVRCGTVPPQDCQRILPGLAWRSMAVFLLTEAGAAVSLLAFCFWQQDFSNSFEKQKQSASDLGFLSTVASSASAAFCMRVVLCWIGPVMINFSLSRCCPVGSFSVEGAWGHQSKSQLLDPGNVADSANDHFDSEHSLLPFRLCFSSIAVVTHCCYWIRTLSFRDVR